MTFTEVKTVLEDLGYDVQIQPSIGNVQTHDLILVSADGQRAILVEIKDNVFTSDVASVDAMVGSIDSW